MLVGILLISGCMETKTDLSLKLKKGDSYKINRVIEEKIVENSGEAKVEVNYKYNSSYSSYVTDVDKNDNATMQITFDSLSVKTMGNNGQTLEYDSGDPNFDKSELNKIYEILPGKSFSVKISPDGRLKDIIGIDELMETVLKELNIKDEREKQKIQEIMVDEFEKEGMKSKVENITSVYYNEKVKVGEIWESESYAMGGYPLEVNSEYTLNDKKDGILEVGVKSKVNTKEDEKSVNLNTIKLEYDIKGEQKGIFNIDEKMGLPKHIKINYKYDGEVKVISEDPNIGSKKIPIIVEGNTIVNISEK